MDLGGKVVKVVQKTLQNRLESLEEVVVVLSCSEELDAYYSHFERSLEAALGPGPDSGLEEEATNSEALEREVEHRT